MDQPDVPPTPSLRATVDQARRTPCDPGHPSARMLSHGSMELRWYAPGVADRQTPHDRDEVYIVVSGTGTFVRGREAGPFHDSDIGLLGEDSVPFQPGDALFVPAGAAHRFEGFGPDFAAWAIFYGPEGGEQT